MAREGSQRRLAWALLTPALAVTAGIALFPLAATVWESLHRDDLRLPWLGRPFIGAANYVEIAGDGRFWQALLHTVLFTTVSVGLELALGLVLALAMNRTFRARGLLRAAVLVPWAIPTVVAALLWRFLFDSQSGIAGHRVWLAEAFTAWVPIVLADVWKTTPFVALLLLAGLQGIDPALHEAAAMDGAGAWQRLWRITLPLLRPALLVALVFRSLDAFRVFDLIYVLTGGGPGTATEPLALYAYGALFANLRFGYGAALSVVVFLAAFAIGIVQIRALGKTFEAERP